ncbi:hypothetical protein [Streptomyces chartreusis]|uniref:Uncharacterized protein n=1 Tax=Streptomyces chartreusis TaxID=1969 RepID=A0A7H8TBP7_STRCX|nr:hypothetical protein [Streptomyces chartreusis]QKZ20382.1 hypothetical protein HUT05_25345 [Streptomyces chartreusis]
MPKRKSGAQVAARAKARELQAKFAQLETTRLETATRAIALQESLAEHDAETERLINELRAKRERRKREMLAELGGLGEEMLETRVSPSEAAARMAMTVGQLSAARRAFNDAVQARAEASMPSVAPETAPASSTDAASSAGRAVGGGAAAVVPQQSGPAGHDGGGAAVPFSPKVS